MLLHTSSAILQNEQTITNLHLRVKEKTIQLQKYILFVIVIKIDFIIYLIVV